MANSATRAGASIEDPDHRNRQTRCSCGARPRRAEPLPFERWHIAHVARERIIARGARRRPVRVEEARESW